MHRFLVRVALAGLVVSGVAVTAATAPAGAAVPCAVTDQRSSTPGGDAAWDPVLSADGSITFFVSDANIGGQNADGHPELWRRVGNVTTNLTSNDEDQDIERPQVSADGTRAVFASAADLGEVTNPDHIETIWMWDLNADPIVQLDDIQDPTEPGAERPTISADGEVVLFHSRVDWDGLNPDGNEEVFLRRLGVGAQQISPNTTGEDGSRKPVVSGDGNVVVYESDRDPLGENADGNVELFRYVVDTAETTQITHTEADAGQEFWMGSYDPVIDGDGSTVVFETEVAHGSLNTGLGYQLMRWDDGDLSIIAHDSWDASVSADGTRVAFSSDEDLVGQNTDGNVEVFLHHDGTIRQVTRTTGGVNETPRISRNGNHIAFGSDRNFLGKNGDGSYEVFVATCGPELKCDGQPVTVVVGQNDPTAGDDVIYGTPGNDRGVSGNGVNGGRGNDLFCGLAGNDRFNGGGGTDRFLGDAGNDTADDGSGADVLKGQAGNDDLTGGSGRPDVCDGGPGNGDTASGCEQRLNIP